MRRAILLSLVSILPVLTGCLSTAGSVKEGGPRVKPDENDWRRSSVPLPPLYLDFSTAGGDRWTMVTPLYWQVIGPRIQRDGEAVDSEEHYHLFPLAGYARSRAASSSAAHLGNYFWGRSPEGSYHVLFPVWWDLQSHGSRTSLVGPLYRQSGGGRERTLLVPWLYSSEKDSTGYDYWSICFRLFGLEKQVFNGEERRRLWLFFVFKFPLA